MTLWALFRQFRRKYLWASEIHKKLSKIGPLSLQIKGHEVEGKGFWVEAQHQVPNKDLITQLAILMYPFLDPSSNLYWQRILEVFEERFAEEMPQILRKRLEIHAQRLSQASMIPIKFKGELLNPQRVYLHMARGFYFSQDSQAQLELGKLFTAPLMGPILWDCFYNYTVTGFELTSALYDIFLKLRQTAAFQAIHREREIGPGQCVYCKTSEGSFTSEEHVLPESLGSDELVLERGYVCDTCNNGLLALLDQALLEFGPIAFLKTLYIHHIKGGKLPSANLQNMEVKKTAPTHIEIHAKDKTGLPRELEDLGDGWVRFTISPRGGTSNLVLVARAYFKIALGTIAHERGAEFALSERYDPARAFICGEQGFPNPLILNSSSTPHGRIVISWQALKSGTEFLVDIFGVMTVFNLEVEPSVQIPANFSDSGCVVFDLSKTDGFT